MLFCAKHNALKTKRHLGKFIHGAFVQNLMAR
jgi:hypothetical protein